MVLGGIYLPNNNDTTTKFKVDISELKSAMQEAKRQIAIANSEFKVSASSMDDWGKSADGVGAKLKQLDSNLKSQKTILESLEEQYRLTVAQMGEGSKEADNLQIAINNQKSIVNNTVREISKYQASLEDIVKAEEIAAKTGKSVDEVLDDIAKSTKDADKAADDAASGGFTVFKGALADLASKAITAAIDGCKKLGQSLMDLGVKADDLNTLSAQSGFSTEMLQKFEYAADRIDVDVNTIVSSARRMKKNMVSSSKDTTEAFERLGVKVYDANGELRDSNEIFFEIVEALSQVSNETERDTLAMQLFGKSADDLAGLIDDGGAALREYGEEAEKVGAIMSQDLLDSANEFNDSVDQIKATTKGIFNKIGAEIAKNLIPEVKDLAKNAGDVAKKIDWSKVIETVMKFLKKFLDIIKEIASAVLPVLLDLLGFVADNFETLAGIVLTAVGVFKAFSAAMAISSVIQTFSTAVAASTTAVTLAQKAQMLWNAVLAANPIGLVATAIGGLVLGIMALVSSTDDATEAQDELTQSQLEAIEASNEAADAFRDEKSAADELAGAELANIDYVTKLYQELQTLVDANGKVKEGYEGRAEFILGELNNALDTEYQMNDGIIEQYGDMKKSIYDVIEAKKAEILLTSYQDAYKTAIQEVGKAEEARAIQAQRLAEQQDVYAEAYEKATNKRIELNEALEKAQGQAEYRAAATQSQIVYNLELAAEKEKKILDERTAEYESSASDVGGYYDIISAYETASTLVLEGETAKAIDILGNYGNGFKTAASVAKESADDQKRILEQQVINTEINLGILEADYAETSKNLTDAQKREAENRIKNAQDEAEKAKAEYVKVGGELVAGLANGISAGGWQVTDSMKKVINDAVSAAKNAADIHSPSKVFADKVGKWIPAGIAEGINANTKSVKNAMKGLTVDALDATQAHIGRNSATTSSVVNNFYQTNNSPKALSRLDIYRQSKNLLGYAGGTV